MAISKTHPFSKLESLVGNRQVVVITCSIVRDRLLARCIRTTKPRVRAKFVSHFERITLLGIRTLVYMTSTREGDSVVIDVREVEVEARI